MTDWITPKQAMTMLGVGPTTIKRWADNDTLACIRTAGGHRRFRRTDVERLCRENSGEKDLDGRRIDAEWTDRLVADGDIDHFRRRIIQLHEQTGDWFDVADRLQDVGERVTHRRTAGLLSGVEKSIASSRLRLALQSVAASFRVPRSAPVCSLAPLSDRKAQIGLTLAQLCLRSAGIETIWANAAATSREAVVHAYRCDMQMLAICTPNTLASPVMPEVQELVSACRDRAINIVIVGNGPSPAENGYNGNYCGSFAELRRLIDTHSMYNQLARSGQSN